MEQTMTQKSDLLDKAKTFKELEQHINGQEPDFADETYTAKQFAEWLDSQGFKVIR